MKIYVAVKTRAKKRDVIKIDECTYRIFTPAVPRDNEANEDIIDLLSDFFGVSKLQVKIISGLQSNKKIVEIT